MKDLIYNKNTLIQVETEVKKPANTRMRKKELIRSVDIFKYKTTIVKICIKLLIFNQFLLLLTLPDGVSIQEVSTMNKLRILILITVSHLLVIMLKRTINIGLLKILGEPDGEVKMKVTFT